MVGPWTSRRPAGNDRRRTRLARVGSPRSEDGFTLVEVMVGTGVMITALVMLAGVMTSGLTATAVARERQSANGLANQTLEQVRALPYETLARGLDTSDVAATAGAADPRITACGDSYCYQDERLVHGTNAPLDPLVPHMKEIAIGPSAFSVSTYVTNFENQATANAFRVTVHVAWSSGVRSGASKHVEAQTIVYASGGCLSLAVHPYSGPCQPSFTASAAADTPTITATGTVGGVSLGKATLAGGRASSDMTIEQISRVEGLAQGPQAILEAASGDEQAVGPSSAATQTDNDPGGSKPVYQTQDLASQAAASVSLSSTTAGLSAGLTAGGSGRTTSTTSADPAAGRPCPNLTGVANDTDSLPCGGSRSTAGSVASLSSTLNVGALTVAAFPVAAIGAQTNPTTALTDRAATSGDGTALAQLTRSATDFQLGGLPAILRPVGDLDYFVRLSAYTDSVSSQSGIGSAAPTATSSGTLTYWTKGQTCVLLVCTDTYSTASIPLSSITSATTIPSLSYTLPAVNATVSFSATVTPETKAATSDCAAICTRQSSVAKVTPVQVDVTMNVTVAGSTVVDLTFALDPGTLQAKTTYVPSPTS